VKFKKVLTIVKVHMRTEFHQATCGGSRVITLTEKQKNFARMIAKKHFADLLNIAVGGLPHVIVFHDACHTLPRQLQHIIFTATLHGLVK